MVRESLGWIFGLHNGRLVEVIGVAFWNQLHLIISPMVDSNSLNINYREQQETNQSRWAGGLQCFYYGAPIEILSNFNKAFHQRQSLWHWLNTVYTGTITGQTLISPLFFQMRNILLYLPNVISTVLIQFNVDPSGADDPFFPADVNHLQLRTLLQGYLTWHQK